MATALELDQKSYLSEALFDQHNVIVLLGSAALSLSFASIWPVAFALGGECVWLIAGPRSARFRAFVDRREDRLIAFGTALTEPRTVRYRLRAVSGGTFAIPAPFAEAMYDVTTRARGESGEITVVDAP